MPCNILFLNHLLYDFVTYHISIEQTSFYYSLESLYRKWVLNIFPKLDLPKLF